MNILGISAFYHDSAAALICDGQIAAAAQEERFTRRKHDPGFPERAIEYCLSEAGLKTADVDYVVFYEKPLVKFERLLETYLAFAPSGFRSFAMAIPVWLQEKLFQNRTLRKSFRDAGNAKLLFTEHHESHAASAFYPSPFEEAAFLTLDGVGEWCTTTWGTGRGHRLEICEELTFPHSLGLLYSAVTYHCGFKVNSGEYKLMGLAPYGSPVYADLIRTQLMEIREDGSFWMDMQYFNYCQGLTMTNSRFSRLFGFPPRQPEAELAQCHMDLAASVQLVTEEIVLAIARHVQKSSGMKNLVLAGGVALNCVANGRLLREGPFEDLWVQPASGDAGGAVGAALFAWHQLLGRERTVGSIDTQRGSLLGPAYTDEVIEADLKRLGCVYQHFSDEATLLNRVSGLLADENVVGWFQERMEYGPRALGARSILGDPRSPKMQSVMNLKIKYRESFRPFAPIVLKEHASSWFEISEHHESPYMLIVADVLDDKRIELDEQQKSLMQEASDLRERVNIPRSQVPAVTHVDYSARLQTVDSIRNPRLHGLLGQFHRDTGCPILVNTSFNVRGEPIVCTPDDAVRCFLTTEMDVLVLGNFVLRKQDNASGMTDEERRQHIESFDLD